MNIEQFNYKVNLSQAIIWQYDTATALNFLISKKQNFYDLNQTQFWEYYQDHIFGVLSLDPTTLTNQDQFGLIIWSIILNLSLFPGNPPPSLSTPIFGFNWHTGWDQNQNFFRANYSASDQSLSLTLDQQWLLLRLRYFQLTTRADALDINFALNSIFSGVSGFTGSVYVIDTLQMTITYVFTGSLSSPLRNLLEKYDLLPRPCGVGLKIYSNINNIFGFGFPATPFTDYKGNKNFSNGCFMGGT